MVKKNAFSFFFFFGYHRFAIWLTIWGSALFQPSMNACLDTCSTFIWIFCIVVSLRLKKMPIWFNARNFFLSCKKIYLLIGARILYFFIRCFDLVYNFWMTWFSILSRSLLLLLKSKERIMNCIWYHRFILDFSSEKFILLI